ncbi:MAG: ROK family protein [Thermodesulfobacteriota bacterium]
MKKIVIGVDVGGTNLRAALINQSGRIISRNISPSGAKKGIEFLMENLINLIDEIKKNKKISDIGIGIPGIIDSTNGVLTQAPNISKVKNYPFREILLNKLGPDIPVILENDANCAAVGEWWLGAGKNVNSIIILTMGTGLGGGIILNGELWPGVNGMGAEIGHMTIDPDGPKCNCGNFGCLESFASAEAIRRMVKEGLRNKNLKTMLRNDIKYTPIHDIPELVSMAAKKGDKYAISIWESFGKALGIAIANLTNLLNAEMIIICGGLSNSWDLFIETVINEAKKRGLRAPMENVEIKKCELGDDAGLIGAAYLALNENK